MTRLKLGALTPTRDFNFITDTVRGFIAVAESDQSIGEVINIGSNFEISIGDSVEMIADIMGVQVTLECDQERIRPRRVKSKGSGPTIPKPGSCWAGSLSSPAGVGLARGLAITARWFTDPANLARYKPTIYCK